MYMSPMSHVWVGCNYSTWSLAVSGYVLRSPQSQIGATETHGPQSQCRLLSSRTPVFNIFNDWCFKICNVDPMKTSWQVVVWVRSTTHCSLGFLHPPSDQMKTCHVSSCSKPCWLTIIWDWPIYWGFYGIILDYHNPWRGNHGESLPTMLKKPFKEFNPPLEDLGYPWWLVGWKGVGQSAGGQSDLLQERGDWRREQQNLEN